MKLNLTGLFYEHSGYGKMVREYTYALYRKGIDIAGFALTKAKAGDLGLLTKDYYLLKEVCNIAFHDAPAAQIYTPENYHYTLSSRYNIGYCELETNKLPSAWVKHCNMMQEIWVPTEFYKKVAHESGVKAKLSVIPQGVDTNIFNPNAKPFPIKTKEKFRFFMNGEFIARKNFKVALEAFWNSFTNKDDVCLILKTYDLSDPNFEKNIPEKIAEWKGNRKNTAPVYLLNTFLKDRDIPRLYAAIDCLIHPSSGEGWGFPPLEALACEKPTIICGWGALGEILSTRETELIDYKLVHVPKLNIPNDKLFQGSMWAQPNKESLSQKMISVFHHYEEAKEKAKVGRRHLVNNYSWDYAADRIIERLKTIETNASLKQSYSKTIKSPTSKSSINIICPSYGKKCGIATYTEGLIKGFKKLKNLNTTISVNDPYMGKYSTILLQFQYGLFSHFMLKELFVAAKTRGQEIVVVMHDFGDSAHVHNSLIKTYADIIIVHSIAHKKVLMLNGFVTTKIKVVPHGINDDVYLANKAKNIKPQENLIGYFGFAYSHKGLIELGMAIKNLKGKFKLKALCSIGVSTDISYQYWDRIRRFFNRQNLWNDVEVITGYLDRESIVEELSSCKLIVLPYEDYGQIGTSGASREAMLSGRPLLVTDTPFFEDLIKDKEVFKIENNWPDTIQKGIEKYISEPIPSEMISRINIDSWKRVAEKYLDSIIKGRLTS